MNNNKRPLINKRPSRAPAADHVVAPPEKESLVWRTSPQTFAALTALLLALFQWPWRWLLSGAPFITYILLQGAADGTRILPVFPVWTLVASLNLIYAISATSWLLYWVFAVSCYPTIFVASLWQFAFFASFVRGRLRSLIHQLHFINDKVAFFNLPALEIDTEVDGLMVIRGVTFSLSSLTIVAHGVEVGIKLSDDMELALQCEKTTISLFRGIQVGDVLGNLKGGQYEMTFGHLAGNTHSSNGDALMNSDTPLLRAATESASYLTTEKMKMTEEMTRGASPQPVDPRTALNYVDKLSPDDRHATGRYEDALTEIQDSSIVYQAGKQLDKRLQQADSAKLNLDHDRRTIICAALHDKPSVPHPPKQSIKVTTLQTLMPPRMRRVMHRMPFLYRLLLNPLSYFHPVSIESITVTGSGKWIQHMLEDSVFQGLADHDSEIRHLQHTVSAWLDEANFALQLADIKGVAQVPMLTAFDITCFLSFDDVMAYRTPVNSIDLKQVVRLGGADATVVVPSCLLPHHEHLLPPVPSAQDRQHRQDAVRDAASSGSKPKRVQAEHDLAQTDKDEGNVQISAHARLPAVLDQELLDFLAALVKATKVVEVEKEPNPLHDEVHGIRDFGKQLNKSVKESLKHATVTAVANDRWIAKIVGKITKRLETAQGDVGYSGNLPIPLAVYRNKPDAELSKWLA